MVRTIAVIYSEHVYIATMLVMIIMYNVYTRFDILVRISCTLYIRFIHLYIDNMINYMLYIYFVIYLNRGTYV